MAQTQATQRRKPLTLEGIEAEAKKHPTYSAQQLLLDCVETPRDTSHRDFSLGYHAGLCVLSFFLGQEWVDRHVLSERPSPWFEWNGAVSEENPTWMIHVSRVCSLAEDLFNLQRIPGVISPRPTPEGIPFDFITERLSKNWSEIAPVHLELEGMKLLYLYKYNFRIIHPGILGGKDYDAEIKLTSGHVVYCEMKCPINIGESEAALINRLQTARKQLPKNGCGLIIIRLPGDWRAFDKRNETLLVPSLKKFFAQTSRVAEVVLYRPAAPHVKGTPIDAELKPFLQSRRETDTEYRGDLFGVLSFINLNCPKRHLVGNGMFDMLKKNPSWRKWVFFDSLTLDKLAKPD